MQLGSSESICRLLLRILPDSSKKDQKVPGEYQKLPDFNQKLTESTRKYQKLPKITRKDQKVQENNKMYHEVQESTRKYQSGNYQKEQVQGITEYDKGLTGCNGL